MINNLGIENKVSSDSSPEARAKRLKYVRNLANLSREQLCMQGSITINIHTLVGWENARFGGLTKLGAEKIIKRLEEVGVLCSLDWLLEGQGRQPFIDYGFLSILNISKNSDGIETEDQIIERELALFKAKNANSIDLLVNDDCMLPEFYVGDYVAGIKRFGDEIESLIGLDCIVETAAKVYFLRNIKPGQTKGCYTLVCTNTKSTQKDSILFNIKIDSAAPIIWHRKKNPPVLKR